MQNCSKIARPDWFQGKPALISSLFSDSKRSGVAVLSHGYFLQSEKQSTNQSFVGGIKNEDSHGDLPA